MKLYLDQSDGILGQKVSGQMLNAARLGLVFDENYSSEVIFKLSESQNAIALVQIQLHRTSIVHSFANRTDINPSVVIIFFILDSFERRCHSGICKR